MKTEWEKILIKCRALTVKSGLLSACLLTMPFAASAEQSRFYVVSNKSGENTVVGYAGSDAGGYSMIGEFGTGGKGTGDLEIPALQKDPNHPLANGDDPLISAEAITSVHDGKMAAVVNPGDATVSLMSVSENGSLELVNSVAASDLFPVSLASHGDFVASASVGADNMNGSITLFRINNGKLETIEGARRDLKARPSTIAFSSDGEHVIVNELVTGKIKVFAVTDGTLSAEPVSQVDSPRDTADRFHAIPVGFVVSGDGGDDLVLMSEARFLTPEFGLRSGNGEVVQSPLYTWQTSSISTYRLTDDGQISLVSGDVLTGAAVEGGEIANCWVAISPDGKTLWAANALSSSISSFRIRDNGTAALINEHAYKHSDETLFFSDLNVNAAGDKLYQLIGNRGEVMVFDIADNGDLTHTQTLSGLPELGAYGMMVQH